jgi:hypothetical protein
MGKHSQIGSIGKNPRFRSNDVLIDIKNKTQLFLFSWQVGFFFQKTFLFLKNFRESYP